MNHKFKKGFSSVHPPSFIKVFNLKIHPWSIETTLNVIETNLKQKTQIMQHIVINAAKIVHAQKDKSLKNAINNSHLVNIDGMPVVWALKLLGYKIPERVSGIDLFINLVDLAALRGYRMYFLGATSEVVEKLISNLKGKYPNLLISGYHNGYFKQEEEERVVNNIKNTQPDLLFIGISSPKKELFLNRWSGYMKIPFSMGVGGSFDILAGEIKRAPGWIQKTGLEWLYRMLQEPGRLWKKYTVTNTIFLWMVFKEVFKKIFSK